MSVGHVLFSATLHRDLRGKPLTRSADAPFKPCPGVVPVSDTGTRPGAPSQAQPLRKTHRPEPIGPATQQDGPDGPLNRPLWRVSLVQREREERHEVSAGVITHLHPRRVSRAADRAGAGNANSGRARCTRGASLLDELRQVRRLSGRVPLSSRAVQPARHPAAQTARSLGPSSAERRRAPSRHPV